MSLKISIVVPSYNQASFLEQTLKSIFIQDYPEYEVIVMDGGSNDGSVEIIKKYESKLAYWKSKPDGGQAAALRDGFEKATGDIFAWLNSDDVYLPGAFKKVSKYFEKHPNIETVTGGGFIIDGSGIPTRIFKVNFTLGVAASGQRFRYYNQNGVYQQSTFWRKTAYQLVGGVDPNYQSIMDRDLFYKLSMRKKFGCLPYMLSGFRFHGETKFYKITKIHDEEVEIFKKKYLIDNENVLIRLIIYYFYDVHMKIKKSWWLLLRIIGIIKLYPVRY